MNAKDLPFLNLDPQNMQNEIFVDAYGFDGIYSVSNLGRVKSENREVRNGSGTRTVKERILSQALSKDGRLSVVLYRENIKSSFAVSELVYKSFNPDKDIDPSKKCIMHKNKLKRDNRLINLKISSITESHKLNFQKGLLPHLEANNLKRAIKYLELKSKTCTECLTEKQIGEFEIKRNKCKECRKIYKKLNYKK